MIVRRRLLATISAVLFLVGLFGIAPRPVLAATDLSFENLPTDSGWEIDVEAGSAHLEGDCTETGEQWLELVPVEGACFVQFSQLFPTAFALHRALPGGQQLVFRHVDNQDPFLFAIDAVTLNGNELSFTMASDNFDDALGYRFENDEWSHLGSAQQKMALYLLSETPEDWFDIDSSIVEAVLLSPGEMEVDHDGEVNDGDTDGQWATRTCNLRTGTCDGDNGDLTVTLYDQGGSLGSGSYFDSHPKPWEANGLRAFTKCDSFQVPSIYALSTDGQPFNRYNCDDDNFIAHYSGTITVPTTDDYTFAKSSDDGLTVFIDGELVIDEWSLHGMDDFVGETIHLEAGRAYTFEAWMYDGCCGAGAILLARPSRGAELQIVPATWLGGGGDPSIMSAGGRKLIGSTVEFANARVRWVWMRCTNAGEAGVARRLPRDCSVVQRGTGLGGSLSRKPYRMSGIERNLRLAIYSGGTWHYSATYATP